MLFYWLSLRSRPVVFDPPVAVLDDIFSSGGIRSVEADELRLAIGAYRSALVSFQRASYQASSTWSERIQPYLEGEIPRVDRLVYGSVGRSERAIPFDGGPFPANFEGIFSDASFQGMIAERWLRIDNAIMTLDRLDPMMAELVGTIDEELAGR